MTATRDIEGIAWLTTARDQAAVELLKSILVAGIRPNVVACCPDPARREFYEPIIDLCDKFSVRHVIFEGVKGNLDGDRLVHDEGLWNELAPYQCANLFLVGYMRFATSAILTKARCINLHPATPSGPVGRWEKVVWSLIGSRATETGGMLHIATEVADRGPVISYYTIPIPTDDQQLAPLWLKFEEKVRMKSIQDIAREEGIYEPLFAAIRKRQFDREAPLLIVTLKRLLDGRLRVIEGGVTMDDIFVPNGVCLNQEVEDILREQQRGGA